ncbi:hypothetical protein [Microbacterium sp. XT11]|nr:hypothetical protein [Microbacterium sp. XT11]
MINIFLPDSKGSGIKPGTVHPDIGVTWPGLYEFRRPKRQAHLRELII